VESLHVSISCSSKTGETLHRAHHHTMPVPAITLHGTTQCKRTFLPIHPPKQVAIHHPSSSSNPNSGKDVPPKLIRPPLHARLMGIPRRQKKKNGSALSNPFLISFPSRFSTYNSLPSNQILSESVISTQNSTSTTPPTSNPSSTIASLTRLKQRFTRTTGAARQSHRILFR
jgi:hypothetical protein